MRWGEGCLDDRTIIEPPGAAPDRGVREVLIIRRKRLSVLHRIAIPWKGMSIRDM